MEKTYKYRFSRRAIYWTLVYLVVFVLLGWLLYHLYEGGYLGLVHLVHRGASLIALMSLSIPPQDRGHRKRSSALPAGHHRNPPRRDRLGSPGRPSADEMVLSGIRGLWVLRLLRTFPRPQAVRTRETLRLGVENFVEITDIYEDRLYVSCSDADRLVEELLCPPEATARRKTTKRKSRRNSIGIRPKSRQKTPGIAYFRKMILYLQPRPERPVKTKNNKQRIKNQKK